MGFMMCSLCRTAFRVKCDSENEIVISFRDLDKRKTVNTRTYTVCPKCLRKIDETMSKIIKEHWRIEE